MPRPCEKRHPNPVNRGCRICYLYLTRADYRQKWGGNPSEVPPAAPPPRKRELQCLHLGKPLQMAALPCKRVYMCDRGHGAVTPCVHCNSCLDYEADKPEPEHEAVRWAYGVTTVPERFDELLPRTLASLAAAGFEEPRLFVDGCTESSLPAELSKHEATCRWPRVRTAQNWWLSALELYCRDSHADRYALFQDDFVTCRNLRQYLDTCPFPGNGYWNLYTFPSNENLAPKGGGWFQAAPLNTGSEFQTGRGAVALVFSRKGLQALFGQEHWITRVVDKEKGWRKVDGGIVTAMNKAGWREYVHSPSLTQHTGLESSMGNKPHPLSTSFPGEQFDAMELACAAKS